MPSILKHAANANRTLAFKLIVAAPIVVAALTILQPGAPGWVAPQSRQLIKAVRTNDLMLTATLLENGADPNARSKEGITVLGLALQNDALSMVKLLIDHGADVTLAAQDELSPLALAMQRGQPEVVQLLTGAGAIASEENQPAR